MDWRTTCHGSLLAQPLVQVETVMEGQDKAKGRTTLEIGNIKT